MPKKEQNEFNFDGTAKRQAKASRAKTSGKDGEDKAGFSPARGKGGPLQRLVDENFLQYASYVIRDRAIPALADGLKPVQRRILHSLHEKDDGRFIKVANVVGHTMQYHPHGDASIADALVTLTNKRYLIEGQGNFGNLYTGDRAAAPRYIECRLTELARKEVFNNDLTEFVPSYDGRNQEPVTLPSKLPLLLMLGADGIAVGLATRILPCNFRELLEAQIAIIQKKPFEIFPDFYQGGLMDVSELKDGVGTVRIRAKIEERSNGSLAILEVPYGVTTESLMSSIEDATKKNRLAVKSVTDFTSERVEIVLDLKPGTKAKKVIEALYAFTQCEITASNHIIVIHEGHPREMTIPEVLHANTQMLLATLKAELTFRRQKLEDEVHAKTLIQIFVENRIYKQIEECKTQDAVFKAIRDGLAPFTKKLKREVTQKDLEMLLNVRIRRISLFDINKNRQEIDALLADIATIDKHLARLKSYAVRYLKGLIKDYADAYPRRTKITTFNTIEIKALTAEHLVIRYDKSGGYLGHKVDGDDMLEITSHDKILVAWKDGRYQCMPPPEKTFVDKTLIYVSRMERDRVMTLVYTLDSITYIKRFTYGGVIQNKEYRCAPEGAKVILLQEGTPEAVYVKYKKTKGQRISQQAFHPGDIPVKGAKARGNQMTLKPIEKLADRKPAWWDDAAAGPRGAML